MKKEGWKELPVGAVIPEPGTSKKFETGDWRTEKPVLDPDKCIHCMFCWIYCPDSSIKVEDGKMTGFLYEYCKGCGICAYVSPTKAIKMEREEE